MPSIRTDPDLDRATRRISVAEANAVPPSGSVLVGDKRTRSVVTRRRKSTNRNRNNGSAAGARVITAVNTVWRARPREENWKRHARSVRRRSWRSPARVIFSWRVRKGRGEHATRPHDGEIPSVVVSARTNTYISCAGAGRVLRGTFRSETRRFLTAKNEKKKKPLFRRIERLVSTFSRRTRRNPQRIRRNSSKKTKRKSS